MELQPGMSCGGRCWSRRSSSRICRGSRCLLGTRSSGAVIFSIWDFWVRIDTACWRYGWLTAIDVRTGEVWQASKWGVLREGDEAIAISSWSASAGAAAVNWLKMIAARKISLRGGVVRSGAILGRLWSRRTRLVTRTKLYEVRQGVWLVVIDPQNDVLSEKGVSWVRLERASRKTTRSRTWCDSGGEGAGLSGLRLASLLVSIRPGVAVWWRVLEHDVLRQGVFLGPSVSL